MQSKKHGTGFHHSSAVKSRKLDFKTSILDKVVWAEQIFDTFFHFFNKTIKRSFPFPNINVVLIHD